jgi:parallel beta-helix repeat protein
VRRWFSYAITLSVIFLALHLAIIEVQGGNTVLYVDDDGCADFTKIQDAVDAASVGDSIFVYNGTYYENIYIDKTVLLFGEDKEYTIIDGNRAPDKDVVHITADNVTIQGFTIQKCSLTGGHPDYNCGIEIRSNNNIITNNIIKDNVMGIQIGREAGGSSNNNRIEENLVTGNSFAGVYVVWSLGNCIANNTISSNTCHGVFITLYSAGNCVTYNTIISNSQAGVLIHAANNNTLRRNTIVGNHLRGVTIGYSNNNKVLENNIYNNKKNAGMVGYLPYVLKGKWFDNTWDANYWGRSRLLPKTILGMLILIAPSMILDFFSTLLFDMPCFIFIPVVRFDWHPADNPYPSSFMEDL